MLSLSEAVSGPASIRRNLLKVVMFERVVNDLEEGVRRGGAGIAERLDRRIEPNQEFSTAISDLASMETRLVEQPPDNIFRPERISVRDFWIDGDEVLG